MSAQTIFVLCAQLLFIQYARSQCTSRAAVEADPVFNAPYAGPYSLGAPYGYDVPLLGEPYGYATPFLNEPCGYSTPYLSEAYGYAAPFVGEPYGYADAYLGEPYGYAAPFVSEPYGYSVPYLGESYGCNAPILGETYGYSGPFLGESYGYSGPFLGEPYGYAPAYVSRYGCSGLDFTPTSGGSLPVTSSSALPPVGISLVSDNVYEGLLAVAGELPFVGTVAMDGVVPSVGSGAINHSCGNGVNAMISDITAFAPGYGPAYGSIGNIAPGYPAPAIGYSNGYVDRGCGCAF